VFQLAEAMVLLEDYAASFDRDLTFQMRMGKTLNPRYWELLYHTLNWKDELAKLGKLLERGTPSDHSDFIQLFSECVDRMDEQYLEIREARKAVFQDDPASTTSITGMSLDEWAQPWRCDEKIHWDINEPELGPYEDPDAEPPYESDLETVGADSIEFSDEEVSSDDDSDGEF